MRDFDMLNAKVMRWSDGRPAVVRPGIHLGTNPGADQDAVVIPASRGREGLTVLDNLVNIVRRGHRVIGTMRQSLDDSRPLKFHPNRLGNGNSLVDSRLPYQLFWGRHA